MSKLRIAIVGCGPRGLQCLEALSRRLTADQLSAIEISIFDPAKKFGAGCVYNTSQSRTLKMNFATQNIDFWKTDALATTKRSESLIGWLQVNYPNLAMSDAFVPRAIVGEYLHDCFQQVRRHVQQFAKVTAHHQIVEDLVPEAGGWRLLCGGTSHSFDRVVLTTGHEGMRAADAIRDAKEQVAVYPVELNLSTQRIPARATVHVRGFGLTSIDAALMLTEGRGGKFVDEELLPRYIASHAEPSSIHITSRSGRPMLAKPTAKIEPIADSFWISFRERLESLQPKHGELNFASDIWKVILQAASELLNCYVVNSNGDSIANGIQGKATSVRNVDDWFRGWLRYKMCASSARSAMLQSWAVATGRRPVDIPFALGESWRRLYPQLVGLIGFGGLAHGQMASYRFTSCEMERIAFGPPAESIGKLLRLIRDRRVTIGSTLSTNTRFDVCVNAVIAGPHELASGGPLAKLLQRQLLELDDSSGGVRVRPDGAVESRVLGNHRGLAVFGRATEGWIVGNDTLSRTLHGQIERWAEGIAKSVCGNSCSETCQNSLSSVRRNFAASCTLSDSSMG